MAIEGSTAGWTAHQLSELAKVVAANPTATIYADVWLKNSYPQVASAAAIEAAAEWNRQMSMGTAGGVNATQRAAGHTNPGELTWSTVGLEADNALADRLNAERLAVAAAAAEAARLRDAEWAAYERALLPDMTVPSPWNLTPTNYNPDPLGRTDMERQLAEIAAAEALITHHETAPAAELPPSSGVRGFLNPDGSPWVPAPAAPMSSSVIDLAPPYAPNPEPFAPLGPFVPLEPFPGYESGRTDEWYAGGSSSSGDAFGTTPSPSELPPLFGGAGGGGGAAFGATTMRAAVVPAITNGAGAGAGNWKPLAATAAVVGFVLYMRRRR